MIIDRFFHMWEQQEEFMRLLKEKRGFPDFPVDLKSKEGQKFLTRISFECMGELFEANQHLKNAKDHRKTEVQQLDRDQYVEELVDTLHYFFEICIASGVSPEELYEAYISKGKKNENRIKSGY